jgi:hypothetical protein
MLRTIGKTVRSALAVMWKELFRQREDGVGVKDREGIESAGFDCWQGAVHQSACSSE